MSVYFDASVISSLFAHDVNTEAAHRRAGRIAEEVVISDFAAAEFASALAKRVRVRDLSADDARAALAAFDVWAATRTDWVEIEPGDVAASAAMLRRFDSALRTPDALHIAIAHRVGASLFTFDAKMKTQAKKEGVAVI